MTKIIYIISDKNFGGGSRHLFDLISGINKKKFIPIIITIPSKMKAILKNKCKVYEVEMNSRLDLGAIKKIREIFNKEKPDIVHLHSTRAGILGTLALKSHKVPIIYTEHLFTKDYQPKNKLIHYFQLKTFKNISKNINKVIAVSEAVKNYLVDNNIFSENKIEVIHNGIKSTSLSYKPKSKKYISIGSIGALSEIKGYKYLIEALNIINLQPTTYNLQTEIIGDGEQKINLLNLINKYNLDNKIKIISYTSNIERKINNWDIYVQPSLSESFGLAISEAMNCELPIIASKVGGIPELVDSKSGILVNPKDASALASAIMKLVNSPTLRSKMGKNAEKRIKKYFTMKKMINKTEKLYDLVITNNNKSKL